MKIEIWFSLLCFILCVINCAGYKCVVRSHQESDFGELVCKERQRTLGRLGLNFILINWKDHLYNLTEEEKLNACKCAYTTIFKKKPNGTIAQVHQYPNRSVELQKPKNIDPRTQLWCNLKNQTIMKCVIDDKKFALFESDVGRWCLSCIDIYILGIFNEKNLEEKDAQIIGTIEGKLNKFYYNDLY